MKATNRDALIKITILALPGAFPSTISGPMEIFKLSGIGWNYLNDIAVQPIFETKVVSLDGKEVSCYGGIKIKPEGSIRSVRNCDAIIIPSVGMTAEEIINNGGKAIPWLKKQHEKGAIMASICSGSFLLAEAELLNNKVATTHWGFVNAFRQRYTNVQLRPERVVTEDGNIFCSGGVNSWKDLSLYLVEKYAGNKVALEVSKALLLEPIRKSQMAFAAFSFQKKHDDDQILKIQRWLEKAHATDFSFEELAKKNGLSPRSFKRRFKSATGDTPLVYLHRLRIDYAKHMLESSNVKIQVIGNDVGYLNTQFFRKIFKRYTGVTPRAYREMSRPIHSN